MSTMSLSHAGSLSQTLRRLIRARAEAMRADHPAVVATLEAAMAFVHAALEVERRHAAWAAAQPDGREAQELGRQIDTRIATLHATLHAFAQQEPPLPGRSAASELLWQLFPSGLRDHIQAPRHAQGHANDTLVLFLTSPMHAATVAQMGLTTMVHEIATLNVQLQRRLAPTHAAPLQDVAEARHHADLAVEEALRTIQAFIHLSDTPDAASLRRIATGMSEDALPDGDDGSHAILAMPDEHEVPFRRDQPQRGSRRHQSLQAHATLALQR